MRAGSGWSRAGRRTSRLGQDLHDIANLGRRSERPRCPERVVGEQRTVLLHRGTTPGAVDDDVVDAEVLHLSDELTHPAHCGLLASRVDLERSAATLQRRHQHLTAVRRKHPSRGAIDCGEKRVLHAPGEQGDAPHRRSTGREPAWRPRAAGPARRRSRCHVVKAAQCPRHDAARTGLAIAARAAVRMPA